MSLLCLSAVPLGKPPKRATARGPGVLFFFFATLAHGVAGKVHACSSQMQRLSHQEFQPGILSHTPSCSVVILQLCQHPCSPSLSYFPWKLFLALQSDDT